MTLPDLISRVREALEPFAKGCSEHFNDWCPDETPAWWVEGETPSIVTVGDFRRARALLLALQERETNDVR